MLRSHSYPGTAQHQALLERVAEHYVDDSRVLAVCVFGSLARGNWDQYSDLDLDVVIGDDVQIDVMTELNILCACFAPLGERPLIIVPDGEDAGNIVLASLTELSIRYHSLTTTSPNIVDSLLLVTGKIALEAIEVAGKARQKPPRSLSGYDVDRVLRWAVEVDLRLKRRQFWMAEHLLQLMRQTLIDIFGISRAQVRAYHAFEADADETLKARIGTTFPSYNLDSIQAALGNLLDVLENDLDTLSNGQLQLTEAQREIIAKIRAK